MGKLLTIHAFNSIRCYIVLGPDPLAVNGPTSLKSDMYYDNPISNEFNGHTQKMVEDHSSWDKIMFSMRYIISTIIIF